jgi:hypothetical protein
VRQCEACGPKELAVFVGRSFPAARDRQHRQIEELLSEERLIARREDPFDDLDQAQLGGNMHGLGQPVIRRFICSRGRGCMATSFR